MIISNDVFGLTIKQFERMFKACLDKRKTQEQWILNLRYPDKSSNDYLEYLQSCTDCNKDHLVLLGNDQRQKYLYEHLVKTVGTEIDIRKRQRLFIIQDMIHNACSTDFTKISSGSLAEGLDLPGSDLDTMFVHHDVDVIHNVSNIKQPIHHTTYVIETDIDHPGFARLRKVASKGGEPLHLKCPSCPQGTCTSERIYASVNRFRDYHMQIFDCTMEVHGPCLSDPTKSIDNAFCLRSKHFPHNAIPWATRHRWQWPPNSVIDRIIKYGCLLVPIGPKTISDDGSLWRLSFSVAKKILVHSFNFTQLLCYGLLKLTLKRVVNINNDVKELLCAYFMKTALFWVSEEKDIDTFQLPKLFYCFSLCLDKLISWVNICYCPNYFIPEHNMFLGKINQINNKMLVPVLESIKSGWIDGLIKNLFLPDDKNNYLLSTNSESSSIMLDFLFYRSSGSFAILADISTCYKCLAFTKSLLKSESSAFIIDGCTYTYAEICKYVAQLIPSPNTIGNTYNIRKCYHRHLQYSIKTDAVSGWLLYASIYYVTGQFNVTLRLTDYILSRCSPDMLNIGFVYGCGMCEVHTNGYRQNVHYTMTLNDRIKMATVNVVPYCQHSSLIPEELQLKVRKGRLTAFTPVIMAHCLRFLSYHHLDDIFNRQRALRNLYLTVKKDVLISVNIVSDLLTILGVCCEISGDKDAAYQCYEEALQCDCVISCTAKQRKSKLDSI